jgi:hypothetical protein
VSARRAVLGLLTALAVCGRPAPTTYVVRPLTVEVVDAETGRALRGIRVHRLYETERYAWSNPLEPSGHRYLLSTLETDADGRARLARDRVELAAHEYFTHENVYVNLDPAPGALGWDDTLGGRMARAALDASSPEHAEAVVTPAAGFRGCAIFSTDFDFDAAGQGRHQHLRHDEIWNPAGLKRPEQTIVVRLRRHRQAGDESAPPSRRR